MAALKGIDTGQQMTRHAAALRAQGFDFVIRYYSHTASKNLDAAEARALAAAGLRLGVIWESAGDHAGYFSREKGQQDAAAALGGGYRVGVYGSGMCCGYLLDHGLASCSWLSQSTGFAGSKAFAQAQRYDLIQALPRHIALDGASVDVDPDTSNPDGNPGLFQPA